MSRRGIVGFAVAVGLLALATSPWLLFVDVPLAGGNLGESRAVFEAAGLRMDAHDSSNPGRELRDSDLVIEQQPPADTRALRFTSVRISVISARPEVSSGSSLSVPDVRGMPVYDAVDFLNSNGFSASLSATRVPDGTPGCPAAVGVFVAEGTEPALGMSVQRGGRVVVLVDFSTASTGWAGIGHEWQVKATGAEPCFECHLEAHCSDCHVRRAADLL